MTTSFKQTPSAITLTSAHKGPSKMCSSAHVFAVDRSTYRYMYMYEHTYIHTGTYRQTYTFILRHRDRQAGRQADRQMMDAKLYLPNGI